jgi:conjugal transfer pilus assembly protein TraB
MMIRVQAPAVLPNEVKANLKGCFVIAEGYGNLATHRVGHGVHASE